VVPVTGVALLLSSWTCVVGGAKSFALACEYAALQIADLALCQFQGSLQCGLGLGTTGFGFAQNALLAKLAPFETINRCAVRHLPVICGRFQRYVLLTGNRHERNCRR
jgi:hypothetical protein